MYQLIAFDAYGTLFDVYSIGTLFYMSDRLKLRLAIWHSHVVLASILHYVAILVGVVLVEAG